MERDEQLDAAGGASIRRPLILLALALLFSFASSPPVWAQGCTPSRPRPDNSSTESFSADAAYERGMSLAQAGCLDEAHAVFLRGRELNPRDSRFPIELGGIAFKQKKYREAILWLKSAERLAPNDAYVHDFLGTLYFVGGNQEAAIKQWNTVGKPVIEDIRLQPGLRTDQVVLDRALTFSRGELLKVPDFWATEARLRALGIFPIASLRLAARPDGKFDVNLTAQEQNGFGSKWEALLGAFGRVFYQTITPEYYNAGGTGTNITSLWRWDAEKRRIAADVSGPLHRNPRWRYRAGVDLRNENWDVRNFSSIAVPTLGSLNMRRSAGGVDITSIESGRLTWALGGEFSYRDFRCGDGAVPSPCSLEFGQQGDRAQPHSALLADGYQLKQRAFVSYDLLRLPEQRYRLAMSGTSELARVWANGGSVFEKIQGELSQIWTLTGAEDGVQTTTRLRAGKTFGDPPFDELFMLAAERDNPLMMRGHIGTNDHGRKGNAPLGRNYFLANNDIDKKLWGNGLIALRLGPFVDVGKITDPLSSLGTSRWLVDAGGQLTVRVLGLQVRASYGRDLRAGRGAFYTWVGK